MSSKLIGEEVIVYDRYLFAVPVKGIITDVSEKAEAYKVKFYPNNPGGTNVTKHNVQYFHYQQCVFTNKKAVAKAEKVGDNLKLLAESAEKNKKHYNYDHPDPSLLETFKTPVGKGKLTVHIEITEFTSLCPITGQPDFATIVIDYIPDQECVESKSLKFYKEGFRNFGEFHESCCQRICTDLVQVLNPTWLRVIGKFTPRGGIPFQPTAEYFRAVEVRRRKGS